MPRAPRGSNTLTPSGSGWQVPVLLLIGYMNKSRNESGVYELVETRAVSWRHDAAYFSPPPPPHDREVARAERKLVALAKAKARREAQKELAAKEAQKKKAKADAAALQKWLAAVLFPTLALTERVLHGCVQ
eukprot:TRINITY_DN12949_c1_g1_i2.p1 TRINITY_DN12949_c1_g1~~TRINITY_DN12949_c1_g1_i2.p1  ORF type:complete len:132 (+),score=22.05 TRINITY_DN12949_c1_g1_i2:333-728(+)